MNSLVVNIVICTGTRRRVDSATDLIDSQEPARQPLPLALEGGDFFCTVKPGLARVFPLACADYNGVHGLLMIFMGIWVIVNWWAWSVPDFHFRKLEAMATTPQEFLVAMAIPAIAQLLVMVVLR